jgi:hypothetical protein
VHDHIVIDERNYVSASMKQSSVSCPRGSAAALLYVPEAPLAGKPGCQRATCTRRGGAIVGYDDLESLIVRAENRAHAPHKRRRVTAGRDHDGNQPRCPRGARTGHAATAIVVGKEVRETLASAVARQLALVEAEPPAEAADEPVTRQTGGVVHFESSYPYWIIAQTDHGQERAVWRFCGSPSQRHIAERALEVEHAHGYRSDERLVAIRPVRSMDGQKCRVIRSRERGHPATCYDTAPV